MGWNQQIWHLKAQVSVLGKMHSEVIQFQLATLPASSTLMEKYLNKISIGGMELHISQASHISHWRPSLLFICTSRRHVWVQNCSFYHKFSIANYKLKSCHGIAYQHSRLGAWKVERASITDRDKVSNTLIK